jgi:ATP-dependent DNA helicase RecG
MSSILPINIENLLRNQGVESARVEFKASWDKAVTGYQVLKTLCAFANDFQNLNGGYIVIGVEEEGGRAVFPPKGVAPEEIDDIQKWIRDQCNRIDPVYQPVFSPEVVDDRHLLVIWAPGSDNRPHQAPEGEKGPKKYFIRIGSETIDAAARGLLPQLLQMTARIPFDDRRAQQASVEDLREGKVREFLHDIHSGLLEETDARELYRKMRIALPVNAHDVPRNIGLLMFSDNPEHWFPGTRIEVVHYAADASGNILEEKIFSGGIHEQLKSALAYLETISSAHIQKQSHSFQVKGWVNYPIPALRESLVNAVYHRGYENISEPVKVYLYSDRMEIISYPGPVPGIELAHFQNNTVPPVPARNRRIGEFLKELKLAEGRGTGLPKIYKSMRDNGSEAPQFDFDEARSYFRVTLPAHPEYIAISALRDAAHLQALGDWDAAFKRVEEAWKHTPASPALSSEYIRLLGGKGRFGEGEEVFEAFRKQVPTSFVPAVLNVLVEMFLASDRRSDALKYLDMLPQHVEHDDALDAAILARRLGKQEKAHRYFERAGEPLLRDTRALHEFAQTKIKLAQKSLKNRNRAANRRLLDEARELLERVLQMDADRSRHGWTWFDLARVKKWLKYPKSDVQWAYEKAIELLPQEHRFQEELNQWKSNQNPKE